jgi:8-oxo-dGTP diphosphatase
MDISGRLITNFAIATDIIVFSIENDRLKVLLVRRGIAPFREKWALPGGFVLENESVEDCAQRELQEETGVVHVFLEQLYTFGAVKRDPRGRVVSVAYMALLKADAQALKAGSDAADSQWHAVSDLPELAFDHAEIIAHARQRLTSKIRYSSIALQLLPAEFTLAELQRVCEILSGAELDKRNFRKQVAAQGMVEETGQQRSSGAHRPAALYRSAQPGMVVYFN